MALLAEILTRYAPEDASAFPGFGNVQRVEMKGGLAGIEPAHASACGAVRMDGGAAAMRRKAIHALYSSSANLVRKTAHHGRPAHLPTADPGPISGGRASGGRASGGGGGGGPAELQAQLRVPDDAEVELLEACARLRKAGVPAFEQLPNGWAAKLTVHVAKPTSRKAGQPIPTLTVIGPGGIKYQSIKAVKLALGLLAEHEFDGASAAPVGEPSARAAQKRALPSKWAGERAPAKKKKHTPNGLRIDWGGGSSCGESGGEEEEDEEEEERDARVAELEDSEAEAEEDDAEDDGSMEEEEGGGDEDRKAARLRAELTVAYCPPCEPMAMRMQGDVRVGIGITIEDLD